MRNHRLWTVVLETGILAGLLPAVRGEGAFEREILPVLRSRCVRCHGPQKQDGRLRLDSRQTLLRGGRSGPAVLAGDSAHSPLFRAIIDLDPGLRMPPEEPPLPEQDIDRIRIWIDLGAP